MAAFDSASGSNRSMSPTSGDTADAKPSATVTRSLPSGRTRSTRDPSCAVTINRHQVAEHNVNSSEPANTFTPAPVSVRTSCAPPSESDPALASHGHAAACHAPRWPTTSTAPPSTLTDRCSVTSVSPRAVASQWRPSAANWRSYALPAVITSPVSAVSSAAAPGLPSAPRSAVHSSETTRP